MVFRKKLDILNPFQADIFVISECEKPDEGLWDKSKFIWIGDNLKKGLCVFVKEESTIELLSVFNKDLKYILPVKLNIESKEIILLAVWANNKEDKEGRYIEQVYKAISYYQGILANEYVILVGDFNSNTIWDKSHKNGNHSDVVKSLEKFGIKSAYHNFTNEEFGKETQPSLFMYRKQDKPYHIDYCFLSNSLMNGLENFKIGSFNDWSEYSDHVPLIVDIFD